ncbi:MAG: STAS/SEC14 domain-containing protein [Deltaproteobacteria bacterium]|nr:STAS/SEC14 domain-containing protein [Deltaproteobacteria bacterium]
MFKMLDHGPGAALGVEISGGYTKEDFEAFKEAYEARLAQGAKPGVLVKIDALKLSESEFKALWADASYGLSHLDKLGRIAVVGHSTVQEYLVKLDNLLLGSPKAGREEKYFDVADLEQAWTWVQG